MCLFWTQKEDILKNEGNRAVFFSYYGSQWCPKTAWLQTFFRISSFVFRTNTFIQVWIYLRMSKWQNFHFWVYCLFKINKWSKAVLSNSIPRRPQVLMLLISVSENNYFNRSLKRHWNLRSDLVLVQTGFIPNPRSSAVPSQTPHTPHAWACECPALWAAESSGLWRWPPPDAAHAGWGTWCFGSCEGEWKWPSAPAGSCRARWPTGDRWGGSPSSEGCSRWPSPQPASDLRETHQTVHNRELGLHC